MKLAVFFSPKTLALVTAVFGIVLPSVARAEPVALSFSEDWRHGVTVYGFLPQSLTGTSTIANTSVDLDLDFQDALELLDFGISAQYEGWTGNWGFIVDANYAKLGTEQSIPLPAGNIDVDLDVKQSWIGFLGGYKVANGVYGKNDHRYSVDLQAGLRYNELKQEADVSTMGPSVTLGGTETWTEVVVGARGTWELSDRWFLVAAADAGLGGENVNSHWRVSLGFAYQAWENTSIRFGWRHYEIDYETERSDGTFAYDVMQTGPLVGVTFSF